MGIDDFGVWVVCVMLVQTCSTGNPLKLPRSFQNSWSAPRTRLAAGVVSVWEVGAVEAAGTGVEGVQGEGSEVGSVEGVVDSADEAVVEEDVLITEDTQVGDQEQAVQGAAAVGAREILASDPGYV